jgi:ABC-type branched-subunit amino acid transport system permease subunit
VYTNGLVFVVIFLSLALLVWTSGQLSLCHAAFVAVGATTFSHLTAGAGVPWGVALVLAGLAVIPVGALVALPAVRLSGIYLALATFGFGVLMQRVAYTSGLMFGGGAGNQTRTAARPHIPGFGGQSDREFYFVVLAIVLVVGLLLAAILRSRLGRLLRGLSDSPTALAVHGLTTSNTRLLVFSLSAVLAGIGGALTVSMFGSVRQTGFGPFESLTWLAVLALSGTAVFRSSIVAALVLAVLPSYAPAGFGNYQTLLFGALAITMAVLSSGRHFRPVVSERVADRLVFSPVRERVRIALAGVPEPEARSAI